MGSMTFERFKTHASATCIGVAFSLPCCVLERFMRKPLLRHRGPRHKADVVLLAIVDDEVPLTIGEAVAVLHGNDRNDPACALDVLAGNIGERDMADFAGLDVPGQGFHRRIKRHCRIGHVELVNVDTLQPQALEAAINRLGEMVRTGVVCPLSWPTRSTRPLSR